MPSSESISKDHVIHVRVSHEDYIDIKSAAKSRGVNVSQLLRGSLANSKIICCV